MRLSPITKSLSSFCLLPVMAASTFINSGCADSDKAIATDTREEAQIIAKNTEREERFTQFHAEMQEDFLTRLEEIDLKKGKSFLYQELIKLCNDAANYNCEQMLNRFRGNVLPEFFQELKEFAEVNLPGFKAQHDLTRIKSETGILSPWDEAVFTNQLMIRVRDHCKRELRI